MVSSEYLGPINWRPTGRPWANPAGIEILEDQLSWLGWSKGQPSTWQRGHGWGVQVIGNAWSSWSQNQVVIRKDVFEILNDEGTDLTSLLVIGIIVTWWKAKCSQAWYDVSPFTETLATAVYIDFIKVACIFCAVAVTDTVKALQVWWGFWWSDNVVNGNTVFRVRKADFFDDSTKFFKVFGCI